MRYEKSKKHDEYTEIIKYKEIEDDFWDNERGECHVVKDYSDYHDTPKISVNVEIFPSDKYCTGAHCSDEENDPWFEVVHCKYFSDKDEPFCNLFFEVLDYDVTDLNVNNKQVPIYLKCDQCKKACDKP